MKKLYKTWDFWADEPISWEEISDSSGRTTLICTSRKIFSNDFLLAQKFLWRCGVKGWRVFSGKSFQKRHALGFDTSNLSVYKRDMNTEERMKNKVYEEAAAITPELLNKMAEQIKRYSDEPDVELISYDEFKKRQHVFIAGFFSALHQIQNLMDEKVHPSIIPSKLEWAIHFLKKNIIERSRKGEL